MKYGIFFRHPLDRDRGLKMIDLLYFSRAYNHFSLAHDKNFKRECLRHTESYLNGCLKRLIFYLWLFRRFHLRFHHHP